MEQDFFDVTLARGDDPQMESHKVILWASSPFFRKVLHHNVEEKEDLFGVTLAGDDDAHIDSKVVEDMILCKQLKMLLSSSMWWVKLRDVNVPCWTFVFLTTLKKMMLSSFM